MPVEDVELFWVELLWAGALWGAGAGGAALLALASWLGAVCAQAPAGRAAIIVSRLMRHVRRDREFFIVNVPGVQSNKHILN